MTHLLRQCGPFGVRKGLHVRVCVDKSSKLLSQHSFSTQESKTRESYDRTLLLFTSKAGRAALRCFQSAADSPVVANMTGREPVNIRRLLRENDQYAAADEYARDVQKGDAVSSWHEHQSRKSSRPEQMPPQNLQSVDLKVVACSPKDRLQRKLAEELFLLNKAALLARKERMRERLQQDTASVQKELATKGLAIATNID